MPNRTNELQYVALSTSARIIAKMDLSDAGDSRTAFIDSMIQEVSSTMTDYLGVHTLRAERTEQYQLRKFSRNLSLDAFDVSDTITVKVARRPSDFATTTAETIDEDFTLDQRMGSITLLDPQPYDPAWFEVTYTGGFFTDTSELGTKHQWLTNACEMQVLYRLQRQDTLGGNVDVTGAGTSFTLDSYGLLPVVRAALRRHRRVIV